MSESNSSKPPSPKARQLARQQGRIALSGDLATAVSLIGSVIIVYLYSARIFDAATQMLSSQLASTHVTLGDIGSEATASTAQLLRVVGECVLAVFAFVLAAWSVQTGLLFASIRIIPDVNRVNPITGAQRLFSPSNLTQAFSNLLKIAIVGGASYGFFRSNFESIGSISQLHAAQIASRSGVILYELTLISVGALILIGIVDYAVKRNQFEASLSSTNDDSRSAIRSVRNDPSSAQANRYRPQPIEETDDVK